MKKYYVVSNTFDWYIDTEHHSFTACASIFNSTDDVSHAVRVCSVMSFINILNGDVENFVVFLRTYSTERKISVIVEEIESDEAIRGWYPCNALWPRFDFIGSNCTVFALFLVELRYYPFWIIAGLC